MPLGLLTLNIPIAGLFIGQEHVSAITAHFIFQSRHGKVYLLGRPQCLIQILPTIISFCHCILGIISPEYSDISVQLNNPSYRPKPTNCRRATEEQTQPDNRLRVIAIEFLVRSGPMPHCLVFGVDSKMPKAV